MKAWHWRLCAVERQIAYLRPNDLPLISGTICLSPRPALRVSCFPRRHAGATTVAGRRECSEPPHCFIRSPHPQACRSLVPEASGLPCPAAWSQWFTNISWCHKHTDFQNVHTPETHILPTTSEAWNTQFTKILLPSTPTGYQSLNP